MYQWVRHQKEEEKRTIVTFTQEWRELDLSGGEAGYRNPPRYPPLHSATFNSKSVSLGAYQLTDEQISKLSKFKLCSIPTIPAPIFNTYSRLSPIIERSDKMHHVDNIANDNHDDHCYTDLIQKEQKVVSDFIYFNGQARYPQIGTVRLSYEYIPHQCPLTIVAVQHKDSFRPFFEHDAYDSTSSQSFNCCDSR